MLLFFYMSLLKYFCAQLKMSASKSLNAYEAHQLALIKKKVTDIQPWPVRVIKYDEENDWLLVDWLFKTLKK